MLNLVVSGGVGILNLILFTLLFTNYEDMRSKSNHARKDKRYFASIVTSGLFLFTILSLRQACNDPLHKFIIKAMGLVAYVLLFNDLQIKEYLSDTKNSFYNLCYLFVLVNMLLLTILHLTPLTNLIAGSSN